MFGFGKKKTPEQPTQSQSISITNTTMSSAQVAQAGGSTSQQMQDSKSQSDQTVSTPQELLDQVLKLVNSASSLSEVDKTKATAFLEATKVAVTEPEPDKSYIAVSLQRVLSAICSAGDIYTSAKRLIDQVLQAIGSPSL